MVVREPRVQPPSLEAYADMPLFNTKAVVHQTGVPAPTLRAWERRYGILAPQRGANDYRLYSERDMMTVIWLRERVEAGLTISQAIALLRSLEPAQRRGRALAFGDNGASFGVGSAATAYDDAPANHQDLHDAQEALTLRGPQRDLPANDTGAARDDIPSRFALDELTATLVHHFTALDEAAANHTIAQALAVYPVEDVCLSLFAPALAELGRRWAAGEGSITIEHFGSALTRAQLDGLFRSAALGASGPLALVGCAPGEQHELGSLMLALFLRRAGMRVVYLGQNLEEDDLLHSISAYRPACVVLSATLVPQAQALIALGSRLRTLPEPRPALFFGGQAFDVTPELATQAMGFYLGMNADAAAQTIRQRMTRAA